MNWFTRKKGEYMPTPTPALLERKVESLERTIDAMLKTLERLTKAHNAVFDLVLVPKLHVRPETAWYYAFNAELEVSPRTPAVKVTTETVFAEPR